MCLKRTTFVLEKKNGRWIGYGWKAVRNTRTTADDSQHIFNRWMEANPKSLKGISADDFSDYPGGFHVFLSKEHARQYSEGYKYQIGVCTLHRVMFEGVVAFGKNRLSPTDITGVDCVIATRIKILKQ